MSDAVLLYDVLPVTSTFTNANVFYINISKIEKVYPDTNISAENIFPLMSLKWFSKVTFIASANSPGFELQGALEESHLWIC